MEQIEAIVSQIHYLDWQFYVGLEGDTIWLRVEFIAPDTHTRKFQMQYGRRWLIERNATEAQVVTTCWKAVLAAVEHEAREEFTYNDQRVFTPHLELK